MDVSKDKYILTGLFVAVSSMPKGMTFTNLTKISSYLHIQ